MPTTVFKTIKAVGGDYASILALEAANANLVALDQAWIVTADNLEETTAVNFNGWTTSATCSLTIRAADPHESTGRVTTNATRISVVAGGALAVTAIGAGGLVVFDGIQFKSVGASSTLVAHSNNGGIVAKVRYINCVFENAGAAGIGIHLSGGAANTNDIEMINCVTICVGACMVREYRDIWLYGSTFVSTNSGGFCVSLGNNDGRTRVAKSIYSRCAGGGTAFANVAGAALVAALSNDTSGSVDNIAYDTANFVSVTDGTEDLTLPEGSALIGAGADRSAEAAPFNYVTDIRGVTRPLTLDDVGAFQVDEGGGGKAFFVLGW